jgi:excisionase family DNA binding protein
MMVGTDLVTSRRNLEMDTAYRAETAFVNVGKAAAYLGVSPASLRQWSDEGLVRVYRTPGGQRRYRIADLEAFIASLVEQPAAERKAS